jgi:hypothetical protein
MTNAAGSSLAPRLGTAGLVARIALSVFLGIPLLALVWEALNELFAGSWNPSRAGMTGSMADPRGPELSPDEEPVTTGTLFLTMIILMIIGAVWGVAYYLLISR